MIVVSTILAVVDILICIAIIALVVVQEGHDRGLGALGGSTMDTFFSKHSGRSKEEKQKKLTLILTIAFVIVTVVLYALISKI
ncbi:MAG: preprotein translocase subunit SecG [Fastidiosipilaceae bacterium]|jgi:preprotein translocase subunit SecG|nr:preprotein translocase subunit SecG [Clostridiaceae bacterium]